MEHIREASEILGLVEGATTGSTQQHYINLANAHTLISIAESLEVLANAALALNLKGVVQEDTP